MKLNFTLIAALIAAFTFTPVSFAKTQEQKIEEIAQLLRDNGEIVDSLHESLELYIEQRNGFEKTLAENHDYMFNNPEIPWFGAANPKLTIAVFTDLSCPWCKKLDPVLHQIVKELPNDIKVVNLYVPLKERGNGSNSATFALNVWKGDNDKFKQVEKTMMSKPGIHNARSIMKVATTNDVAQYVSTDDASTAIVEKNYELFMKLGASGTPAILIDGEVIPGYMPFEDLFPLVKQKLKELETQ